MPTYCRNVAAFNCVTFGRVKCKQTKWVRLESAKAIESGSTSHPRPTRTQHVPLQPVRHRRNSLLDISPLFDCNPPLHLTGFPL